MRKSIAEGIEGPPRFLGATSTKQRANPEAFPLFRETPVRESPRMLGDQAQNGRVFPGSIGGLGAVDQCHLASLSFPETYRMRGTRSIQA